MFTSGASRVIAPGAAAALATTIAAVPADATVLPSPCTRSGPYISLSPDGSTVLGSCFVPGAPVTVDFWDSVGGKPPWRPTESVRASYSGTFSVPTVPRLHPLATEYINAQEGGGYSNIIIQGPEWF